MKYVECPKRYRQKAEHVSLFIAGGITHCPQWQNIVVEQLKDTNLVLLNPRRTKWDFSNRNVDVEQITWEFRYLNIATAIMFWFPKESVCPIALYELGSWIHMPKKLFIGYHQEYPRSWDLSVQIPLVRKKQIIHEDLEELVQEIKEWAP